MIPKIIHYCWFGGNPLTEDAIRCIESWKKYCQDFEIIEWNENNFDVQKCPYVKEAYEAKKWAFVSDYARFWILYNYGGVYFDTDVELIKPIDDILDKGPFMGVEREPDILTNMKYYVAPGLGFAAYPRHQLFGIILNYYENAHFYNKDGSMNLMTVVKITTDILYDYGLQNKTGIQCVEGIYIYPKDYFCPLDYLTNELVITPNTRSIHYYSASWQEKKKNSLKQTIKKRLAPSTTLKIMRIKEMMRRERHDKAQSI